MFAQPALTPVEIDYQTLSRFVSTNLTSSTLLRIEGSRKIQNVYFKTYVEKKRTTLYSKVRATPLSLEMLFRGSTWVWTYWPHLCFQTVIFPDKINSALSTSSQIFEEQGFTMKIGWIFWTSLISPKKEQLLLITGFSKLSSVERLSCLDNFGLWIIQTSAL